MMDFVLKMMKHGQELHALMAKHGKKMNILLWKTMDFVL